MITLQIISFFSGLLTLFLETLVQSAAEGLVAYVFELLGLVGAA